LNQRVGRADEIVADLAANSTRISTPMRIGRSSPALAETANVHAKARPVSTAISVCQPPPDAGLPRRRGRNQVATNSRAIRGEQDQKAEMRRPWRVLCQRTAQEQSPL